MYQKYGENKAVSVLALFDRLLAITGKSDILARMGSADEFGWKKVIWKSNT
jgi:hypothetical protein